MTTRIVYTPRGHFAPEHEDYAHEADAHLAALRISREHGIDVEVHELP